MNGFCLIGMMEPERTVNSRKGSGQNSTAEQITARYEWILLKCLDVWGMP